MNLPEKIFFAGIGGIGMSALARFLNSQGHSIYGYDRARTQLTETLSREGMTIVHSEREALELIDREMPGLVVWTPALSLEDPLLKGVIDRGIPLIKRAELLAQIVNQGDLIAVAGTHGKSTTSTLITYLMDKAGRRPTAFLGAIPLNYGSNYVAGDNRTFVVEADEYDRSFLLLKPTVAVITHIEWDHTDIYPTFEDFIDAFNQFVGNIKPGGKLIINATVRNLLSIHRDDIEVITYGIEDYADVRGHSFRMVRKPLELPEFSFLIDLPYGNIEFKQPISLPGKHNASNITGAVTTLYAQGLTLSGNELVEFQGIERRFQIYYADYFRAFIDDYAHHPTEVKEALKTVRTLYPDEKITVIFHPHLYSRTQAFAEEFGKSLSEADAVVVTDIYPAREKPIAGVDPYLILKHVEHPDKFYIPFDSLVEFVRRRRPRVLVILGAGDINKLADRFKEVLLDRWFMKEGVRKLKQETTRQKLYEITQNVKEREPLSKHTTLRIGGEALFFVNPQDKQELLNLLEFIAKEDLPYFVLGRGSNLLVGDYGMDAIVMNVGKALNYYEILGDGRVVVGAGVDLPAFVLKMIKAGLGGLEPLAGIPGTVGGAVLMNAGAYGAEIFDFIEEVEVFRDGRIQRLRKGQVRYAYRYTDLYDSIILEAVLKLKPIDDIEEALERRRNLLKKRNTSQPLNKPNAGCIFKNPSIELPAGKLIDELGLKGFSVGGVMVSPKHANFLINANNATALDMLRLIEHVRNEVFNRRGVLLQMEVQKIGKFVPDESAGV
ncbi:MAG: UDP-N-acetylmuramate--L-alanine ligase [Chlorobi bacterium]|nr:UDP-N-acetylmuramate--L-alanine ligase [Chlorobiota bacterium]